mgnify:CR=1 FL=1
MLEAWASLGTCMDALGQATHLLTLAGDRMAIVPNVLTCELFAYLS